MILNIVEPKYSKEPPACWEQLAEEFDLQWGPGVTVTYGDTVHTLDDLSEDKKVHEFVHVQQQCSKTHGPKERFLERYLKDQEFRYEMELEAYRSQWAYIKQYWPLAIDRNKALEQWIGALMGYAYGLQDKKYRYARIKKDITS